MSNRRTNITVLREYPGGSETINLSTSKGWANWVSIVQDWEAAQDLAEEIDRDGFATINDDEPEFFESYTKVDAPDEDDEYTVTLTGHQWQLVIDCLGDTSDGDDHLHALAVSIHDQVTA